MPLVNVRLNKYICGDCLKSPRDYSGSVGNKDAAPQKRIKKGGSHDTAIDTTQKTYSSLCPSVLLYYVIVIDKTFSLSKNSRTLVMLVRWKLEGPKTD